MSAIKVEVTAEDIRRGSHGECAKCPIARAMKRVLKTRVVWVAHDEIQAFLGARGWIEYKSLVKVQNFIHRFDHDESVKPFSFILRETL